MPEQTGMWVPFPAARLSWERTAPNLQTSNGRGVLGAAHSPGVALAVSLVGYYSLAGFANVYMPDDNLGGILIRGTTFAIVVIAFVSTAQRGSALPGGLLVPAGVFFLAYLMRLVENIYFSDIFIPPGPEMIFPILIFGSIVPSFLMARIVQYVNDDDFAKAIVVLNGLFLVGMALNLDELNQSMDSRLTLGKINAISMASTAVSFLCFHLLFFRKSKFLILAAAATMPFLFLIVIYARARGIWVSGTAAILIYILVLKGRQRIWSLLGFVGVGAALFGFGGDYVDIIWDRLMFTDVNNDTSTYEHYIAAAGAWQQFMDDFAFGRYAIELQTDFYPHNIYLEVLMSIGFFGAIPFAIHLVFAARAAIGIIRTPEFSRAPTFIAIQFIFYAMGSATSGGVWGAAGFWICSFMVIALWYARPRALAPPFSGPGLVHSARLTNPS
jgi:hypothetical protein